MLLLDCSIVKSCFVPLFGIAGAGVKVFMSVFGVNQCFNNYSLFIIIYAVIVYKVE